ncbi:MAG: hypothetical protein ABGX36_09535 [Cycloclasticus sp.]
MLLNHRLFSVCVLHRKNEYAEEVIDEITVISRALNHDYAELIMMGLPSSSIGIVHKWKVWPMIEHADLSDKAGRGILHYSKSNANHEVINMPAGLSHAVVGDRLLFKRSVMFGNETIGEVSYELSNARYEELIRELYEQLVIVIPIALGLSILLSLWLQHIFVYPLQNLMAAIKGIGVKRDYSARISVAHEDRSEFATLGKSFNSLLSQVETTLSDIKTRKPMRKSWLIMMS